MPLPSPAPIPTTRAAPSAPPQSVALAFSKISRNSVNTPFQTPNPYSVNLATNAIRIWFGTGTGPAPMGPNPQGICFRFNFAILQTVTPTATPPANFLD